MKKTIYLVAIHAGLLLSLALNFIGLYGGRDEGGARSRVNGDCGKTDQLEPAAAQKRRVRAKKARSMQPDETTPPGEKKEDTLLSVYVMPHPPNFLTGRRIYFKSYQSVTIRGKKYIRFTEKRGGNWTRTLVESEAIRWR